MFRQEPESDLPVKGSDGAPGRPASTTALRRRGVESVILVGAGLLFWWFEALTGFSPTDDGFILAQSWRIMQGEVPHVDFTSPRPVGSGLLHLPVLLFPDGLLAISRLIVTAQLMWLAFCGVTLLESTTGRLLRWRPIWVLAAFVVNVGVWPVMAWHTIDGLFLGLTSFWLADQAIRRGWSSWAWIPIWILSGAAPLAKQGFMLVPLLVGVACLIARERRALWAMPLAFSPAVGYATWVRDAPGGLGTALHSGSLGDILQPFRSAIGLVSTPTGLVVVACITLALGANVSNVGRGNPSVAVATVASVLIPGATMAAGWLQGFHIGRPWAYLPVLAVVMAGFSNWRLVWRSGWSMGVLSLSFASSLSWGTTGPSLLAGTLIVWAIGLVLGDSRLPDSVDRVVALTLVIGSLVSVIPTRHADVYGEGPASTLSSSAVGAPSLRLIRMSPQAAAYVDMVQTCVNRYPASWVAVSPDGAALYPILRLRNPMPSDWRIAEETASNDALFLARTFARLRSTEWLMLMQTYRLDTLSSQETELISVPREELAALPEDIALFNSLDGTPLVCGSLLGKYQYPSTRR